MYKTKTAGVFLEIWRYISIIGRGPTSTKNGSQAYTQIFSAAKNLQSNQIAAFQVDYLHPRAAARTCSDEVSQQSVLKVIESSQVVSIVLKLHEHGPGQI